jgi:transposase
MQSNSLIHGVDVAKDELVIGTRADKAVQRLDNKAAAIRCWLRQLPKGSVVAMESTGRYHRLLAQLAFEAGMQVYVLNARNVHFYAKGLGMRSKTDRVDTGVIARYVAEHQDKLHPWRPQEALPSRTEELLRRRALVVTKRESLRQSLRECPELKEAWQQLDRAFGEFLRRAEAQVKALIKADEKLRAAQRCIQTVIGFGLVGSALLASLLQRIPFASSDSLVAYSGWDPRPDDSGRKRGKRRLTKAGPAYMRKQWYMVGFTAARTKALKPLYLALRARGMATTEAAIILGRKLLRAAYAVWKTGRAFDLQAFLGQPKPA